MPVDSIGNGLEILIKSEYTPFNGWMALSSWYSISKNLPDAKVVVACKRKSLSAYCFGWAYKLKVKMVFYNDVIDWKPTEEKFIKISDRTLAIRTYDENDLGPVDVKSDQLSTFVEITEGCGNFVASEWIHRNRGPFQNAVDNFSTLDMSANESKVLRLWQQLYVIYSTL